MIPNPGSVNEGLMERDVESAVSAALARLERSPEAFAAVAGDFGWAFLSVEARRKLVGYSLNRAERDREIALATEAAVSAHRIWLKYRHRDHELTGDERALGKLYDWNILSTLDDVRLAVADSWFPDSEDDDDIVQRQIGGAL